MLENMLFSLNCVMPFFLLILAGYLFKRWKLLPESFLSGLNKFVYKIALPANLFYHTATVDFKEGEHFRYLVFAVLLTIGAFFVIWGVTELFFRDKKLIGTLVQGSFRGNFALLGLPLATAVVGQTAAAPAAMALAAVIPVYSVLSIVVLNIRGAGGGKPDLRRAAVDLFTNPMFLATILGGVVGALRIPMPQMVMTTVNYISGTAAPLGLLSIGGLFNLKAATARIRPAAYAALIKIVVQPLAMVPICYLLGFRGEQLFLYMVMFGSPVAVSSFSVATELGGDGPLASNILIITTLFSSVTLSFGIYLMRTLGWV